MSVTFDIDSLRSDVAATHPLEWVATVLGVVYVLLILRRNRLGWIAGGLSSAILMVLAARSKLPMQAFLQFAYVVLAVYGWWNWSRGDQREKRIGVWPWSRHVVAIAIGVALALAIAPVLRGNGSSDWPFLDPLIAYLGLFASWLTARMRLENWIYWIAIDSVSLFLFYAQGHPVIALLFLLYLVISCAGLRSWYRLYRAQPAPP